MKMIKPGDRVQLTHEWAGEYAIVTDIVRDLIQDGGRMRARCCFRLALERRNIVTKCEINNVRFVSSAKDA